MSESRNRYRKKYIDVIRYLSIVWVMFTHFVTFYDSNIFHFVYDLPLGILLYGVSGKFAVTMLAVILGYLASLSREKGIIQYCIERYFQFFIMAFVINFILYCSSLFGLYIGGITMLNVVVASVKIDASIFPTFWCMRHFLYGSIICAVNGKLEKNKIYPLVVIFEICFLLFTKKIWIMFCILGSVINYLKKFEKIHNILNNKYALLVIFILIFIIIKRDESDLTYIIDGIISFVFVLIVDSNNSIQNVIEKMYIPDFILNSYFGLFLIHPLIEQNYCNLVKINPFFDFVACFIICSLFAYLVSLITTYLISRSKKIIKKIFVYLKLN